MQDAGREMFGNEEESQSNARLKNKSSSSNWFRSDSATRYVYGALGFFVIALVLSWLQFSTKAICCGDYDGYYHIRWSQLLWENFRQGKWLPEFIWLPLTVLSPESYADHHFLFHLLQIPFLWFFEPIMAAKVAAVFFATLAIFSCYWLVLRYNVDYPIIWLLGLLTCAQPFYYRMNMAKAPPLSIICTVLGIWLLFERRYKWLLPLTFVFVWTYSLYPMLIIAALIWGAIILWNENKLEWHPAAYTIGGAILGNIINPYFPRNIWLFVEHAATKIRVTDYSVPVGGEWYDYGSWTLLGLCIVAMLAMVFGYILYHPDEKKFDEKSTFFLVFATFLMVWTFQSKRFAEYFPPMAILFAAFSWQAFTRRQASDAILLPEEFRRDLDPFFDRDKPSAVDEKRDLWQTAFVGLIIGILLIFMFLTLRGVELPKQLLSEQQASKWCSSENPFKEQGRCVVRKGLVHELEQNDPPDRYQKAMEWAINNIPAGERIFNTDWDDFPKMFFHDQKHIYISGLDPNYLFSRNPDLSKLYDEITTGKTDDPAPLIRDKFGAKYVFSDNNHEDFYGKAMDSGWFDKVFEDGDSFILKMRDQKGAPPPEADDNGETSEDDAAGNTNDTENEDTTNN